jgi:hypothetical protein
VTLMGEPVEPGSYERMAAAVLEAGGEIDWNEYDSPVSVHYCTTCGQRFTICPPSVAYGADCLMEECGSYDPARDAEVYFAPDDPDLTEEPS